MNARTGKAVVRAENLVRRYTLGGEVVNALAGVSFEIVAGEMAAIIGPSGSGKSTLMNLMGGLDRPTEGALYVGGENLATLPDRLLASFRNRTIGFVFQSFQLLPRLTALENVELPMVYGNLPTRERRTRAEALLDKVGLGSRMGHRPTQLSGGQQQRVAIARSLANQPSLLLADEPTGALDQTTGREILALFRDLNADGTTVVLVTHDSHVAASARRVLRFSDGVIIADGAPDDPGVLS